MPFFYPMVVLLKERILIVFLFFWDHVEWKIDLVGGLRSIVNATNESRRSTETKIADDSMTLKQVSERFAGTPRHLSSPCVFVVMAAALVRPGTALACGRKAVAVATKNSGIQ